MRSTLRMDPEHSEERQRRDAKRELAKLEARLAGDLDECYTLRQWSETWLQKHLGPDASPVTVYSYRWLLDSRILPQLGDTPLEDLTPALLTDWLYSLRHETRKTTRLPAEQLSRPRTEAEEKQLARSKVAGKPLAVKTILLYYGCMKTMLAAAVRVGILEHNPMDRVQRPKKPRKKITTLSEDEAVALLRLVITDASQSLRLAVMLALLCSLRLGEVCALTWQDFDDRTGTITVSRALKYTPQEGSFIAETKTAAGDRVITLPAAMVQVLKDAQVEDHFEHLDDPEKWLGGPGWIVHSRHGARVNKDTPSKWFRSFADAHGFRGVTFHDLRHAHASLLVASGADVATIAARMGHSDPSITLSVYTHALPQRDREAAATMDQLLTAALPAPDQPEPAGS